MILIESKINGYKVLSENTIEELNLIVNELTNVYEQSDIFLVDETKDKTFLIRDFATKNKGYYSSLIICDNENQITSLAQLVRVSAQGS